MSTTGMSESYALEFQQYVESSCLYQKTLVCGKDYQVEVLKCCPPSLERIIPQSALEVPFLLVSGVNDNDKKINRDYLLSEESVDKYSESELDTTGCPLEYNFDVKISSGELDLSLYSLDLLKKINFNESNPVLSSVYKPFFHKIMRIPLRVEIARCILSLYLTGSTREAFMKLPVWVMCDGSDPLCTVLMGVHKKEKAINRLLISTKGPLSPEKIPSVAALRNQHLGFSEYEVHTVAYSRYNVFETIQETGGISLDLDYFNSSRLILECTWSKVRDTLQKPGSDCTCFLLCSINGENQCSFKWEKCKELRLIQSISNYLADNSKEIIWPRSKTSEEVVKQIKELMSYYTSNALNSKVNIASGASCLSFNNGLEDIIGNREDMDFSDELWNVLKECPSAETLQQSLSHIFHLVESKEVVPFLTRRKLYFQKLLQDVYENGTKKLVLDGQLQLQLLLELGLQKLQRDYVHFFITSSFATYDQLQPFLAHNNFPPPLEAVKFLESLHSAVEVIVLCKTFIHLQLQSFISLSRHLLDYCSTVSIIDPVHLFKIPVSFSEAKYCIERLQPSEWQVSFSTKNDNLKHHTVCHLSKKVPMPFITVENVEPESTVPLYFYTLVTSIEDDIASKQCFM